MKGMTQMIALCPGRIPCVGVLINALKT